MIPLSSFTCFLPGSILLDHLESSLLNTSGSPFYACSSRPSTSFPRTHTFVRITHLWPASLLCGTYFHQMTQVCGRECWRNWNSTTSSLPSLLCGVSNLDSSQNDEATSLISSGSMSYHRAMISHRKQAQGCSVLSR